MKIPKVSKNSNDNWENNAIQFARLIAELDTVGAWTKKVIVNLAAETDLTTQEICALIDRAKTQWDKIKEQI